MSSRDGESIRLWSRRPGDMNGSLRDATAACLAAAFGSQARWLDLCSVRRCRRAPFFRGVTSFWKRSRASLNDRLLARHEDALVHLALDQTCPAVRFGLGIAGSIPAACTRSLRQIPRVTFHMAARNAAFSLPSIRQCDFHSRNCSAPSGKDAPRQRPVITAPRFGPAQDGFGVSSNEISRPVSRSLRPAVTARMESPRSSATPGTKSPVTAPVVARRMLASSSAGCWRRLHERRRQFFQVRGTKKKSPPSWPAYLSGAYSGCWSKLRLSITFRTLFATSLNSLPPSSTS